ncbi:MAG: CDP-alcohol phosphatidyltransferase family protein [Bacteroidetes bacterium]|nr:CDP-alcohol phosphatidyltransferase family protein [Bacteroidota bacterium]
MPQNKERIFTIPNFLSAYRLLSFPFILLLILNNKEGLVAILICINLVTDILDGIIARVFHMQTKLGARLDSLADVGTYILVFWALYLFKREELGMDMVGVWLFLGMYIFTHLVALIKFKTFPSLHLYSIKITGYLQGIYFFLLFAYLHVSWWFWIAIGWGMVAWTEEFLVLIWLKEMQSNCKSIFHLIRNKQ